jgi:Zn-dependent membrane protease YugP
MPFILLAVIIIGLIVGPGIWVKRVLKKYDTPRDDLPGTGGELAAHLMERFEIQGVTLEKTEQGDHYDPDAKAVRLTENVMNGSSLTAVATAAHEVGHALQHAKNYTALTTRTVLAKNAYFIQNIAGGAIFLIPILAVIPGLAIAARVLLIFIIGSMFLSALIHFITLPVEFDASFGKALPILEEGNYVNEQDLKAVKKILLACALTYVSQAMMGVLNLGRWIRLLRR